MTPMRLTRTLVIDENLPKRLADRAAQPRPGQQQRLPTRLKRQPGPAAAVPTGRAAGRLGACDRRRSVAARACRGRTNGRCHHRHHSPGSGSRLVARRLASRDRPPLGARHAPTTAGDSTALQPPSPGNMAPAPNSKSSLTRYRLPEVEQHPPGASLRDVGLQDVAPTRAALQLRPAETARPPTSLANDRSGDDHRQVQGLCGQGVEEAGE